MIKRNQSVPDHNRVTVWMETQ